MRNFPLRKVTNSSRFSAGLSCFFNRRLCILGNPSVLGKVGWFFIPPQLEPSCLGQAWSHIEDPSCYPSPAQKRRFPCPAASPASPPIPDGCLIVCCLFPAVNLLGCQHLACSVRKCTWHRRLPPLGFPVPTPLVEASLGSLVMKQSRNPIWFAESLEMYCFLDALPVAPGGRVTSVTSFINPSRHPLTQPSR